jgi:hypothetical protein
MSAPQALGCPKSKIWIDEASRPPTRGRGIALGNRGVAAVDITPATRRKYLDANRIVRVIGLGHCGRGGSRDRSDRQNNPNRCAQWRASQSMQIAASLHHEAPPINCEGLPDGQRPVGPVVSGTPPVRAGCTGACESQAGRRAPWPRSSMPTTVARPCPIAMIEVVGPLSLPVCLPLQQPPRNQVPASCWKQNA